MESYLWNSYIIYNLSLVRNAQYRILLMLRSGPVPVTLLLIVPLLLLTDIGGLIVLLLFLQQWPIAHCLTAFNVMTRRVFQQRHKHDRSILSGFRHILRCWLANKYYNIATLETCLKETFSNQQRIFDYSDLISGTKIAVTASTISDTSTYVFSNYNGTGNRRSDCGKCLCILIQKNSHMTPGYKHLHAQSIDDKPFIWQA